MQPKLKKVGLVLGGGAARGMAHIGVLDILEQEGIPIDMIAGTSAGAAVGALYAHGRAASEIVSIALDLERHRLARFIDPSLPRSGFIKGKKIKDLIASFIGGDIKFSDLKIPFACVAADIDTGEEVVIDRGSVPDAVRASISIPGVFTVVRKGERYLVDGVLVNPVPVNVVKHMGASFIIAVNVIPDLADRTHHRVGEKRVGSSKEPNLIHIMMQSIYIGTYSLVRHSLEETDVVIEPHVNHIGAGDFHQAQECIRLGRLAARNAMPEIKRAIKNL
jgi:NTE family protein